MRQAILVALDELALLMAYALIVVLELRALPCQVGLLLVRHVRCRCRIGRKVSFAQVGHGGRLVATEKGRVPRRGEVRVPFVQPCRDGFLSGIFTRELRKLRLLAGGSRAERVDGADGMCVVEHNEVDI